MRDVDKENNRIQDLGKRWMIKLGPKMEQSLNSTFVPNPPLIHSHPQKHDSGANTICLTMHTCPLICFKSRWVCPKNQSKSNQYFVLIDLGSGLLHRAVKLCCFSFSLRFMFIYLYHDLVIWAWINMKMFGGYYC